MIDLTPVNGTLSLIDTWTAALDALRKVSGLAITDARYSWSPRGQTIGEERWWTPDAYGVVPTVTLSKARAPARDVLDELLALGGRPGEVWSLIWPVAMEPGASAPPPTLMIEIVQPLDEALGNLAPIPPKDPTSEPRPVP